MYIFNDSKYMFIKDSDLPDNPTLFISEKESSRVTSVRAASNNSNRPRTEGYHRDRVRPFVPCYLYHKTPALLASVVKISNTSRNAIVSSPGSSGSTENFRMSTPSFTA
ncbi:hypothetical protein SOVF_160340 [Spinacia oleracea]|nr:hypothetical protein SOVF_160340 [Spinacia oleracea]